MNTRFEINGHKINFGNHPKDVATTFRFYREPIVINLEPGDSTRYTLMFTLCNGDFISDKLAHFGIPYDVEHNYVIVTYLYDDGGISFYHLKGNDYFDLPHYYNMNPHTRDVILKFLELMWKEYDNA